MKTPSDKKQPSEKTVDALNLRLNKIADAAYAISWIGEELSKSGAAKSEGELIRHTANAIAKEADKAIAYVENYGGAL